MSNGWHHWETWECIPVGMYETRPPNGFDEESALRAYEEFLRDLPRFESALCRVLDEWPISCEQFLSNSSINRIAWLGQSSMSISTGIPACFRAGFKLLSDDEQAAANAMADKYFRVWLQTAMPRKSGIGAPPKGMQNRIGYYVQSWEPRGYETGIPEEVPPELMQRNLAPSYKAIAIAILKNDHHLTSLGYSQPASPWYNEIKRIELMSRPKKQTEPAPVVAHTLFDHGNGMPIELPSDPILVEKTGKEIDDVIACIKGLDSDSKLALVRRLARGANSVSKLFNVAVFILDRVEEPTPTLFEERKSEPLEMELV